MANIDLECDKIYQIKLTLLGSEPPIWRRLKVPGDSTFEELHGIIQVSFEWENAHLHQFVLGDKDDPIYISHADFELEGTRIKNRKAIEKTMTDLGFDSDLANIDSLVKSNMLDECVIVLREIVSREGGKLLYEYDFGDNWEVEILIEKIFTPEPDVVYPICVDGARSAPPDDCGGIPGYADLLGALRDLKREDHEDAVEWIGENFDPEEFDIEAINAEMLYYDEYLVPSDDDSLNDDDAQMLSEEKIEEVIEMINEQTKAFIQEVALSDNGFALRFPGGIPLVNVVIPQFATMTYAQYPQLKVIYEIGPGSEPVWIRFAGPLEDIQAVKEILRIEL
ncbi:MAG: plasmid pRiA4b ORF-3 family protein [Anaerolineae bacterium]|nr:plasmid pRiA4b ORF-3 family protein [Anaerolineae bacterium]